jgi:type I restriction enzyme S subunit
LTTNQGFKSFVPITGIRSEFLLHWLRSAKPIAEELASGTTFLELSGAKAATIPVPVAPELEQDRICARLDEFLVALDQAERELKVAQRKLALYCQSLLKAAVEGQLTAEWRGESAEASRATSTANAEGWSAIPEGWRWSTAKSECGFITKGTTPPKSLTSDGPKCVPFLRVTNLTHDGSLNLRDQVFVAEDVHRKFLARSIVKPGDVLMNIVGPPLGQVSLVPSTFPEWNVNQAIAIFRVQHGLLNEYLACVLLSPGAGQWLQARAKTTAGQTNLTLEVCRALPVPVPPLAEQAEIVRLLNQQLDALAEQGRAIDRALAMAAAQRQNILRAAFSGQLVPQEPNDEPASVLLERIRSQRPASEAAAKRKPGRPAKVAA